MKNIKIIIKNINGIIISLSLMFLIMINYGCTNSSPNDLSGKFSINKLESILLEEIVTYDDALRILGKPYSIQNTTDDARSDINLIQANDSYMMFYSYITDSTKDIESPWQGIALVFEKGKLSFWIFLGNKSNYIDFTPEETFRKELYPGISSYKVIEIFGDKCYKKRKNKKIEFINYFFAKPYYEQKDKMYNVGYRINFDENEKLTSSEMIKASNPDSAQVVEIYSGHMLIL